MDDIYYIIKSRVYELAQYAVEEQYKIQPAWTSYGSAGYIRALEDSRYHMLMLASSYALNDINMLGNYYSWLDILFKRLKLPANTAFDSLNTAAEIIDTKLRLNDSMKNFVIRITQNSHHVSSESVLQLSREAQEYYNFITKGNQRQAVNYILDIYKQGMQIIDIYNTIFIPIQSLIGKLWHEGKISVGEEHYCTAVTQVALANLYQFFFTGEKKQHKLIAAAVSGELHELPIRFLADVFEMHNWNTHYYGASTPLPALLQAVSEHKPNLLCLSVTMPFLVPELTEYIATIKKSHASLPIMVGGRPFSINQELYKAVGADAAAETALLALKKAEMLL
ncbi:MAG TPA: cobalamin-dependent protein [Spirochaetia bacterium]|nr:cobalamin-dependent protein [Spirochaetales bacterium]HRS65066.1 cobalamin-dependent protein [Spirochaetia bacterium]HOT59103.1 cobalamin-dependent protein [Spirochaetales bacterium]HPD80415.1 cobalamin-dependent protein [Spirochaetales bacterium]HQG39277.1 cobalamin-dependent protein [Spirochaetales bacterium]